VIELPLRGECKAIHSPGHYRYAFDLVAAWAEDQRHFAVSGWSLLAGKATVAGLSWSIPLLTVAVSDGWPDRPDLRSVGNLLTAVVLHRGNASNLICSRPPLVIPTSNVCCAGFLNAPRKPGLRWCMEI
jgi:hypothetical protein